MGHFLIKGFFKAFFKAGLERKTDMMVEEVENLERG
jgi:hypothetical protein